MKLQYAVVFERAPSNYCAYIPDIPGCIAADDTLEDTKTMMREAIEFLFETKQERGEPIPMPTMNVLEAMAYHASDLDDVTDADVGPGYEATVALVEVEFATGVAEAASG